MASVVPRRPRLAVEDLSLPGAPLTIAERYRSAVSPVTLRFFLKLPNAHTFPARRSSTSLVTPHQWSLAFTGRLPVISEPLTTDHLPTALGVGSGGESVGHPRDVIDRPFQRRTVGPWGVGDLGRVGFVVAHQVLDDLDGAAAVWLPFRA